MNKKGIIFVAIIIILIIVTIVVSIFIKKKKARDRDYELLSVTEILYYPLEVDSKYGVIKKDGTILVEPSFDDVQIPNQSKAVFVLKTGDNYKVVNDKNEELFKNIKNVSAIEGTNSYGEKIYNNSVLKYKESNKYGILSFDGKKITDPLYDEMSSLEDKYGEILVKEKGKYGVINIKGISLVKCKYDYVKGDGYSQNGSYKDAGYIIGNKTTKGMVYGYIDKNEKEIIKMEQENIYRVSEIVSDDVYLVASTNGRYAIFKNKENLTDYKYIDVFYNVGANSFTVQKNKTYGLVNLNGEVVIKEEYDELMAVGIFVKASKAGKNYTFTLNGDEVVDSKFAGLQSTSTGKLFISIDSNYRYGLADTNKEVVIENQYDYIDEVDKTGLLIASNGSDVTVYSPSGTEIVSLQNAEISFINNYIKVETADEMYYLTADGKKVDNKTVFLENHLYAHKEGGKWGFVDLKDDTIVDYIYDEVTEVNEYGFAGIKQDGKWGVIDKDGHVVVEPIYESNEINPVFIGKYCLKNGVVRNRI